MKSLKSRPPVKVLIPLDQRSGLPGHLASYLEPMPESATAGDWGSVYGELLTFDDPSIRLPAIDRLESFHPGGPSLYRRILVPAFTGGTVIPVWLYRGDEIIKRSLAPLGKSRWF
ncbi:MAG: gamma-glutamylcyclotransferase [Deltaproteobacteria bacterium]|nr:gamma-glutamylcyclotransferase [Deltaproteobacteria bacterium]